MKIMTMSLDEAMVRERFIKRPHAFIRVSDPRDTLPDLPDNDTFMGSLSLKFYDADSINHISKKDRYLKDGLFTEMHAEQILDFVEKMKPSIDVLICHCRAGISRSAGISAALSFIYDGSDKQVFNNKRFMPNMLVYRTILKVWDEGKAYNKEVFCCPAE